MPGYVTDIEKKTLENENFRRVLYTVYSPPNHRDDVVHATKAAAETDDEHFDGHASV